MTKKRKTLTFMVILSLIVFCTSVIRPVKIEAATKKTVYVITKIESPNANREFTYNAGGFIQTEDWGFCVIDYKYTKSKLLKKASITSGEYVNFEVYNYSHKNGRRTKVVETSNGTVSNTINYKYNKNGFLKQAGDVKYRYNGKKISQIAMYGNSDYVEIKYDENGNIEKDFYNEYVNTYENGRLTCRSVNSTGEETIYTYEKIKVDKNYVKKIRQQQWSLLNNDIDQYFGIKVGWG